jgi:hypothetical protein
MNPTLKDIVKEELQKLLNVNFIYPISDSQWVSPLVIVPKKNEKWRICVDYRELNKATQKDHFPFPFIDQVLDALLGKNFFSFLDGFNGYNQIHIAPEDQEKLPLLVPGVHLHIESFLLGFVMHPLPSKRAILGIFSDLVNDSLEIYMDDFTPHGNTFDMALDNLEKVLKHCKQTHLSLSTEKCHMMMNEGVVLGHYLSSTGIQVDQPKLR